MSTFYIQTRKTPAACRSRELRSAGITPKETAKIEKIVQLAADSEPDNSDSRPNIPFFRYYRPGNRPEHAVYFNAGTWLDSKVLHWDYDSDAAIDVCYYCRSFNPVNERYEISVVWHDGEWWACASDETTQEPGVGSEWIPFYNPDNALLDSYGEPVLDRCGEPIIVMVAPASAILDRKGEPLRDADGDYLLAKI